METILYVTTGVAYLDALLENLVTACEHSFPGRIRSYYLGGSSSDGTAVGHDRSSNSSDVDLFVIFNGTMTEDESANFQRLVAECQFTSPVQLDAHAFSEDDVLQMSNPQVSFLNALIRESSLLLYGNDMHADLPPVQFSHYVLDVIESGVFHLGIPRQRESIAYPLVTPLVFPLTYPDPAGEFYGYDAVPARPGSPRGTRVLVSLTAWIATLILALESGRYAGQKSQCMRMCKEYLPNDRRTQLAATVYNLCKNTWGYAFPEHAKDREQLRSICRETLALENEYLRLMHDYLLARLQQSNVSEQKMVSRILQSVVYPDDDIRTAVRPWQDVERA